MAVFKIIKGEYKNKDAIKNVITYILGKGKENKTPNNIFGALGVDYENINLTISQFEKIQRVYRKDSGKRILHIVVGFSKKEAFSLQQYLSIGYDIAKLFGGEHQVFFGLHENRKNKMHIHFAVNPVNVYTGEKIHWQKQDIVQLNENVRQIVLKYQAKNIKNRKKYWWHLLESREI